MRQLIKEQMQKEVQDRIKQLIDDSLYCYSATIQVPNGHIHLRDMEFQLRDIKIEPGEVSIALNFVSGTYVRSWEKPQRELSVKIDNSLVMHRWFGYTLRKMKYYNVNQCRIHISYDGKSRTIFIPPLKAPQ